MLTPSFEVAQDSLYIVLTIQCPYIKAQDVEIYIDGTEFKFHGKPYFLSLSFPGELVDDARAKAVYDVDAGVVTIRVPKKNQNEHFPDLGMLTKLLSGRKTAAEVSQAATKSLLEVISESRNPSGEAEEVELAPEDGHEWSFEQQLPSEAVEVLQTSVKYGFASKYSCVFSKLKGDIPDIIDVPEPDKMKEQERRMSRIANEDNCFSPDHYLADLMENEYLHEVILKYKPAWKEISKEWEKERKKCEQEELSSTCSAIVRETPTLAEANETIIPFNRKEKDILKNLPKREYLLSKEMEHSIVLGLVDIICAYVYNHITTEGENSVESAWTVCKLSSTLSWLEVWKTTVKEVVLCSLRRMLCFPLFRNWLLCEKVVKELKDIFKLGRLMLLKCLIEVYHLLVQTDPYYVLADLYLRDYCIWVQHASAETIQNISKEMETLPVSKGDVGWDLEELEVAAKLVAGEESL